MAIVAHPDDESLGFGGSLAKYAEEGVETFVVTATRGEIGRHGEGPRPSKQALGRVREKELRAAARELGVREVHFLGYEDGALAQADPEEARGRIEVLLQRIRPQVVMTFGPDGAYGHPDHIAISQLATAAVTASGNSVSKLYFLAWGAEAWKVYQDTFKNPTSTVDGIVRQATPWPDWSITTRVDAKKHWRKVWIAIQQHRTQISAFQALAGLPEARHEALWGMQTFYRAFSMVNGGRRVESDLFQGLCAPHDPGVNI